MDVTQKRLIETEIKSVFEFAKTLVLKEQEKADAADIESLKISLGNVKIIDQKPRNWRAILGWRNLTTGELTIKKGSWILITTNTPTTVKLDKGLNTVWQVITAGLWTDVRFGNTRETFDPTWTDIIIPTEGNYYIDLKSSTVFINVNLWYDDTTKELDTEGPWGKDPMKDIPSDGVYIPGLSPLIRTPEEYVLVKLLQMNNGYSESEKPAYDQAINSFETYGLWEDKREAEFLREVGGQIVVVGGKPAPNPKRITEVKYRGETNDYYRGLIKDYNISPLKSRTAEQFEVLYWKETKYFAGKKAQKFISLHNQNAKLFKSIFYSKGYETDDQYLNFCKYFITWKTCLDFINGGIDNYLDIDILPEYDIDNLIFSHGIFYFEDLPLIYKKRIAKNINKLISNKGTTEVFHNILSVFGLDNSVEILKYYLVKFFKGKLHGFKLPREINTNEKLVVKILDQVIEQEFIDTHVKTLNEFIKQIEALNILNVTGAFIDNDGLRFNLKTNDVAFNYIEYAKLEEI